MSLSDCIKCFETPCKCGFEYKDLSKEQIIEFIGDILSYKTKEESKEISIQVLKKLDNHKIKILNYVSPKINKNASIIISFFIEDDTEIVTILTSNFDNYYLVIHEDALETILTIEKMTKEQIEKKYCLNIDFLLTNKF